MRYTGNSVFFIPVIAIFFGLQWSPEANAISTEEAVVNAAAVFDVPTFHAV